MGTDYRFRSNHCFYLSFLPKSKANYSFQQKKLQTPFPLAETKDFVEKYFSTRRKKTGRGIQKTSKKMVYTSRKISCPLGRISSFFGNSFPLIPLMVSTSQIQLCSKYSFHKTEYCISTKSFIPTNGNGFSGFLASGNHFLPFYPTIFSISTAV